MIYIYNICICLSNIRRTDHMHKYIGVGFGGFIGLKLRGRYPP